MNKMKLTAGVFAATMCVATGCRQKGEEPSVPVTVEEVQHPMADLSEIHLDSVTVDTTWALTDEYRSETMGDEDAVPGLKCVVDVPSASQAPLLANAVMEWINEICMSGTYDGDLMDVKAMVADAINNQKKDSGGICSDSYREFNIRKVYENAALITFVYSGYDYAFGAAHGSPYCVGATFRKTDGKIFGWNMFRQNADLQPFLKEGLKKYFEVSTDDELSESLMMDALYSVEYLPKAINNPWVNKDGIVMQYQAYEIACYAAGQPYVVIPVDKVDNLLTTTASKLIRQ